MRSSSHATLAVCLVHGVRACIIMLMSHADRIAVRTTPSLANRTASTSSSAVDRADVARRRIDVVRRRPSSYVVVVRRRIDVVRRPSSSRAAFIRAIKTRRARRATAICNASHTRSPPVIADALPTTDKASPPPQLCTSQQLRFSSSNGVGLVNDLSLIHI